MPRSIRAKVARLVAGPPPLAAPSVIPDHVWVAGTVIVKHGREATVETGRDCSIGDYTIIDLSDDPNGPHVPARLVLGDRVRINEHNNIRAGGGSITIGDDTLIAQMVSVIATNHGTARDQTIQSQPWLPGGVRIGRDVWIGAGAVILPGSDVGDGAVVAAGAVVRGPVPPFAIVAGVPARIVGERA